MGEAVARRRLLRRRSPSRRLLAAALARRRALRIFIRRRGRGRAQRTEEQAGAAATPARMFASRSAEVVGAWGARSSARPAAGVASCCWRRMREQVEYHLFLTELSERPGKCFAISAQRVPSFACSDRIILSSSSVHAPFLSDGSRLLHHLSRHCLPVRPGSMAAMRAQCLPSPSASTSSVSAASSEADHGPAAWQKARTGRVSTSGQSTDIKATTCAARTFHDAQVLGLRLGLGLGFVA